MLFDQPRAEEGGEDLGSGLFVPSIGDQISSLIRETLVN